MGNRLAGKVAIVTGAASGIGAACARLFAQEGARVALTDVNEAGVHGVASEIGGPAFALVHDVADEASWQHVVAETHTRCGGLHVLVNNAGIGRACRLVETTMAQWRTMMSINLDGVFLGIKHVIPAMRASGGGSIVNISSIDGILGAPLRVPYCAAKSGVLGLTRAAAIECCELGDPVRVNSVHPGPVATGIFGDALPNTPADVVAYLGGMEGVGAYYMRNTPQRRFADPAEIAAGALYLASDESGFVTGTALVIDGGFTAGKLIRQSPGS